MKNQSVINLSLFYPNTDKLYRKIISFCLLVLIFSVLLVQYMKAESSTSTIQESIASEILRFHVIANSDSEADQALKLEVKDALTEALRPILAKTKSIEEARSILLSNLDDLEILANGIIKDKGFSYTASASIEHGYFPLKVYGDLSLPPGEYEAVRIELGAANGQNWWCIMFPPLCFVDATYSVVPDTSKEQLKYLLTDEEYEAVFSDKKVDIKVKFKILSWFKELFS